MKRFNIFSICNNILISSQYRQIQTNAILFARSRKSLAYKNNTQRITQEKSLSDDIEDEKYIQGVDDDYDLDADSINFMNLDKVYDHEIRHKEANKRKLSAAIMKAKFFSVGKQPQMLTYEEKEKIKLLHEQDPKHWDIYTLSENFPATPQVINKILKCKWKPDPKKIAKMDAKVQRNWELLEKNELEADRKVIKHLKKFINRRSVLYANVDSSNIALPEPEKEKKFNDDEYKNILVNYNKKIEKLFEVQENLLNDGAKNLKEEESSLEKLHNKIKKEVEIEGLEKKESFILGQTLKAFGENLTFEEFQNSILKKADNEDLDLSEKAVLENTLGISSNHKDKSSVNHAYKNQKPVANKKVSQNKNNQEMFENEPETEVKADSKMYKFKSNIKNNALQFSDYEDNDEENLPMPDKNTCFISSEDKIGKFINNCYNAESTLLNPEPDKKNLKKKKNLGIEEIPEKIETQKIFFEKQVEDIKNTSFWDNNNNSKNKKLVEINKSDKVFAMNQLDNYKPVTYPDRIKIPKNHRGSGLTFKVNDCYYDDDGEFLYRVPGMVN